MALLTCVSRLLLPDSDCASFSLGITGGLGPDWRRINKITEVAANYLLAHDEMISINHMRRLNMRDF